MPTSCSLTVPDSRFKSPPPSCSRARVAPHSLFQPFPLSPPQTIFLREPKCQKWHLHPPTGPTTPATRTMMVRLRTEKATLRNDFGHSYGERDVVRISEERR
jgi:hypothetical protein